MAKPLQLTAAEEKLAQIIWKKAPLTSPQLVVFAEAEFNWKKSTTYTVLKKLCDKGIFKNENAVISVLLTQDEHLAQLSRHYVEDTFGGSLPRFITAFAGSKKLSPQQIAELKLFIAAHEEEPE